MTHTDLFINFLIYLTQYMLIKEKKRRILYSWCSSQYSFHKEKYASHYWTYLQCDWERGFKDSVHIICIWMCVSQRTVTDVMCFVWQLNHQHNLQNRDLTQQDGSRRGRQNFIVWRAWLLASYAIWRHFRFITAVLLAFTTWKQGVWSSEENVSIFIHLFSS